MNKERTTSNIIVNVLDLTGQAQEAQAFALDKGVIGENDFLAMRFSLGMVEKGGKHYILDTEGVGSLEAVEDSPLTIKWYPHTVEDGKITSLDMFPVCQSILSSEEVLRLKVVGTLPLHEFVREFGWRLEINLKSWKDFLEETK
jgi:hypothetical protein